MLHLAGFWLLQAGVTTIAVPPAAKVAAAAVAIYGLMQIAKQNTWVAANLQGWVAVCVNVALAITSLFVPPAAIQPADLYTMSTLTIVFNAAITALSTSLGASGIHGMVNKLKPGGQQ
jgi:hypothetical protein